MPLKVGDKAPLFKTVDQNNQPIALEDYLGGKIALVFYPKDNTPTCTTEVCNLRDNYTDLQEAGYTIFGISPDSARKHQNFIKKFDLPFPLLVDSDLAIIKSYGVWGPKKTFGKEYEGLLRTTFIIDENGQIERIIDNVKAKEHATQILAN